MENKEESLEDVVKRIVASMVQQPVPQKTEVETYEAKPYRPGKFVHDSIGEDKEEIYCPTCGTFERRTIPKREVVKEVVKETVPKGYVPQPKGVEDVIPYLELKHQDGKSVFDCPNCSKAIDSWIDKHLDDLKKQGYEIRKVRR